MKTIADDVEQIIKERKAWEVCAWLSLAVNVIFVAIIISR